MSQINFLQFLYELFTGAETAFDDAVSLFRTAESDAVDAAVDAIDLANEGLNTLKEFTGLKKNPLRGVKEVIKAADIDDQWTWFKHILSSTFVTFMVFAGTMFALWLLG